MTGGSREASAPLDFASQSPSTGGLHAGSGGAPPTVSALGLLGALRDPLDFLVRARAAYGDVYALDLGLTKMILLNHPAHAQHVYRDRHANYVKTGPFWDLTRTLVGDGLPVSEGELWRRQRRMIQPHFHKDRLPVIVDRMAHGIEEGMATWDALADAGTPVDLAPELNRVAMKAIVRATFGGGLDRRLADEIGAEVGHAFDYILRGMLFQSLPWWLPVPGRRRYREAIQCIDRHIFGLIERRRRERSGSADLITALIDSVDAETGEPMTDRQLRDEAMAMFLAGYETVASMLTWAVHLLARHPEHARTARAEVDAALGGRQPGLSDLPRLTYTLAVVQEALRLYPPIYFLPRQAVAADEIGGHTIPAGAIIAPVVYVIHRHPAVWDQPAQFDPGRFTAERSSGRHPLAWMPFGAGHRQCLGKDVALMEGQLILARILAQYELEPVGARLPRVHLGATASAAGGVYVRLERRGRRRGPGPDSASYATTPIA